MRVVTKIIIFMFEEINVAKESVARLRNYANGDRITKRTKLSAKELKK